MDTKSVKDFLGQENARNKHNAAMYTQLMQRAMGGKTAVLIGHHLCFEFDQNIDTENEIPSADTLLFDHDVMGEVFGDKAIEVMQHLARTPTESRDQVLRCYVDELNGVAQESYPESGFVAVPA